MRQFFDQLGEQMVRYGPRILWAVVLMLVFYLASRILAAMVSRLGKRVDVHQVVADLLAQVVGTAVMLIGVVSVLGTLGVDVSALVAGLGLVGFAVGFALKDVLSNLLAGVLILYYRPFWIEDRIKVTGYEGVVKDIDLRYTTLETDTSTVLLPNSNLLTNSVEILVKKAHNEPEKAFSAREAEKADAGTGQ
jgi:small-conductance mechanosensitive channel